MINKTIYLDRDRDVHFETYLLNNSQELKPEIKRPLIIICPGGGYRNLSDRESEPIALKYNSMGYHAIVLRYGVNRHAAMPGPIRDLAMTVKYAKDKNNEWYVDKNNIFICGFSAGGHLAASLGVFWNNESVLSNFESDDIRPKGIILGYPVIDLKSTESRMVTDIPIDGDLREYTKDFDMHHPSINLEDIFILENNRIWLNFEVAMNAYMFEGIANKEQLDKYSLHKQVTSDTPPMFIWHGGDDNLILPQNSVKMANSLLEHNQNCELHLYGVGGHGLALSNNVTSNKNSENLIECTNWFEMSCVWIENIVNG